VGNLSTDRGACARRGLCAEADRLFRAPWYVIPSNHKWFRDLAISSILVDTLEEMNLQIPKPSVDLRAVRLRYHSAKIEQKKDDRLKILPGESKGHTGKSARQSKRVHAPKG